MSPSANMARDAELASEVCQGLAPPTVRIYEWSQPAVTIGRRQSPDDLPARLLTVKLPIVQRPTGGGAVLHRLDELTYAVAASREFFPTVALREIPIRIHRHFLEKLWLLQGIPANELEVFHAQKDRPPVLCFLEPVCGDLLFQGRKVAGCAIRVWRHAFLLQGSIQNFPVPRPGLRICFLRAVAEAFGEKCLLRPSR